LYRSIIISFFLLVGFSNLHGQFKETLNYSLTGKDSIKLSKTSQKLSPGKVALLSTFIPGAGQIYNGQWYKAVVLYAGAFALYEGIKFNNGYYQEYRTAYKQRTDGDSTTIDKFANPNSNQYIADPTVILNTREYYHYNRDLLIVVCAIVYAANIIDAYVYAHLRDFNISEDLSMQVNPATFSNIAGKLSYTPTITLKF
jgi:hypothetical protein